MKKYNLSAIMRRAWEIKKEDNRNIFSACLHMAWEEVKKGAKKIMKGTEKQVKWALDIIANIEKIVARKKESLKNYEKIAEFSVVLDRTVENIKNEDSWNIIEDFAYVESFEMFNRLLATAREKGRNYVK